MHDANIGHPEYYCAECERTDATIERLKAERDEWKSEHDAEASAHDRWKQRAEEAERQLAALDGPLGLMHVQPKMADTRTVRYKQASGLRRKADANRELREALRKYGDHHENCPVIYDDGRCECGYTALAGGEGEK